jgi:WD40 repeat protein
MRYLITSGIIAISLIALAQSATDSKYVRINAQNAHLIEVIATLDTHVYQSRNSIAQIVFHPTQNEVYSVRYNETIRVWDTETFEFVELIDLPTEHITSFDLSPSQPLLAYGGWDLTDQPDFATLNIWNLETKENQIIYREGNDNIEAIVFSPDGAQFAATGWDDNTIRVWDSETGMELLVLNEQPGEKNQLSYLDNQTLISSGQDQNIYIWDLSTGEVVARFEGGFFSVHPSGQYVLATIYEGNGQHYELIDLNRPSTSVRRTIEGSVVDFGPDGDTLLTVYNGEIWLADFRSGERIAPVGLNYGFFPPAFAFSLDGKTLALQGESGELILLGVPVED